MHIYHQTPRSELRQVLKVGLKCETRGEKGDDTLIKKTDDYLDAHRPKDTQELHLSRNEVIYGYLGDAHSLIDIQTGTRTPLAQYTNDTHQLLELTVEPGKCFISDLNRYDAVKAAIGSKDIGALDELAERYWLSVIPLAHYSPDRFSRPEVMIIHDVPPSSISTVR